MEQYKSKKLLEKFYKKSKSSFKINWGRLDTWHLEKIRKEEEEENEKDMEEEKIKILKTTLKRVFNEAHLYNLKRRELADLSKKKIEIKKDTKKKLTKIKQKR